MVKPPHKPEMHPDPLITIEDEVPLQADPAKDAHRPARLKNPEADKVVATEQAATKKPDRLQFPSTFGTKAISSPAWCANLHIHPTKNFVRRRETS